ncbi:MAG TPA: hypothetical protein VMB21_16580 [Candidatus Limnocylindria bacterium]|nr:hypothetical protein [Candidatus Limnocylindria bacterium]
MLITITSAEAGAKPVKLADSGSEGVSNYTVDSRRAVQELDFLRALEGDIVARGNRRSNLSFSVTRLHRDLREAELFVNTHGQDLPPEGLLTIVCQGFEGARTTLYLSAVLTADKGSYHGCSTFFTYQLTGKGALSKTKPA